MGPSANPYDPGNAVKPQYFAGRKNQIQEVRRCFESCSEGNLTHVFIKGEWGIGKTSLLLRLQPELEEHATVIRESVPFGHDQGPLFYQAVFAGLYAKNPGIMQPDELMERTASLSNSLGIREGLKIMMSALQDVGRDPIVLILDELERAQAEFLQGIRDIFQRLGQDGIRHMLLFAGKELPVESTDATTPVRRFFHFVHVERMSEAESLEAIRSPVQFLPSFAIEEGAGQLIFQLTKGHPYFLKKICHEIFNIANGQGNISVDWLNENRIGIEGRLARDKFKDELEGIPDVERKILLRASLLEEQFHARTLREELDRAPDVALMRLCDRGLLRRPARGTYEIYHPLFRDYLRVKARELSITLRKRHGYVPEGRPALAGQKLEEYLETSATKWLAILDQHFESKAVSFLEAVKKGVRIRILMGQKEHWDKTTRQLDRLEGALRKNIEIRAWQARDDKAFPAHARWILGDQQCWESSHSLGQVGRKATSFTDKTTEKKKLRAEFDRWWKDSKTIYPKPPNE